MFRTPSHLPETNRAAIVDALNATLADGLDLHGQLKVAHWNLKGPHFAALHPLFESFAEELAETNDDVAERAVTLGGVAVGTVRKVAAASRLAELPEGTRQDLALVAVLADRIEAYLVGVRAARKLSDDAGDIDTSDLLTGAARAFEKHAWFLRATLEA